MRVGVSVRQQGLVLAKHHPCVSMCGCCNYRSKLLGPPPACHGGILGGMGWDIQDGMGQPKASCASHFWEISQFSSHYPPSRKGLLFWPPYSLLWYQYEKPKELCGSALRTV